MCMLHLLNECESEIKDECDVNVNVNVIASEIAVQLQGHL